MGITICETHGRAGIVETCHHVAQDIDQGHFGEYEFISVIGAPYLCKNCQIDTGYDNLQKYSGMPIQNLSDNLWEEAEAAYKKIDGRRTFCSECVAAVQVEQARKDNKPDPFPVYEKTITSHHRELADALERHLISRFNFRTSIVTKNQVAILVLSGNYRTPFTVQFYYVDKKEEQEAIINLISEFFQDITLNQVRLQFWEKEVWHTWTNQKNRFVWRDTRR